MAGNIKPSRRYYHDHVSPLQPLRHTTARTFPFAARSARAISINPRWNQSSYPGIWPMGRVESSIPAHSSHYSPYDVPVARYCLLLLRIWSLLLSLLALLGTESSPFRDHVGFVPLLFPTILRFPAEFAVLTARAEGTSTSCPI